MADSLSDPARGATPGRAPDAAGSSEQSPRRHRGPGGVEDGVGAAGANEAGATEPDEADPRGPDATWAPASGTHAQGADGTAELGWEVALRATELGHGDPSPAFGPRAPTSLLAEPVAGRPSNIVAVSKRVGAIVEAAERAAEKLRRDAEQRARDRIAEADRAGDLRVEAAEDEALEIVDNARRQAAEAEAGARAAVATIHERAAEARAAAEHHRLETIAEAEAAVSRLVHEADEQAKELRGSARAETRELLDDAHYAAREVVREAEELTGNLRALAQSLVRNADQLTRDVALVHGQLVSHLDAALPPSDPAPDRFRTLAGADEREAAERQPDRTGRGEGPGRRGSAAPLPAEIAGLSPPEDASFDVPEFVKAPRRGR